MITQEWLVTKAVYNNWKQGEFFKAELIAAF